MNLVQQITPKNEDGSIDHRYRSIAKAIVDLAGQVVEDQLHNLFVQTHSLEKEAAPAGLQLCIALFSVPMDERFQRSKLKRHIHEQLQEMGFKPSKVSKLMGAAEFYARTHNRAFAIDAFGEYFTESEQVERQNRFLDEYFNSISKLYELSRMSDGAVDQVRREFLNDNKIYIQDELEELRRSSPKEGFERRGRKPASANFQEVRPTYALAAHESLAVMDDAIDESVIEKQESGQKLIKQFFELFMSGEIEHRLAEFTPNAQAHLIDEIKAGIPLLEEFVAKNRTIEVTLVLIYESRTM